MRLLSPHSARSAPRLKVVALVATQLVALAAF